MAPVIRRSAAEPRVRGRASAPPRSTARCWTRCSALFGIVPDIDLDLMRPGPDASTSSRPARLAALDATLARGVARLAPGPGRHDDRDVAALGARSTARVRVGPRRGGAAHGRLRPSVPRGDEPPGRRTSSRRPLRPDPARGAGAASRGRAGRPDLPHGQHGRRRAAGDRGPRRRSCREEDLVLITAHRRESFGEPLERIVRGDRPAREALPRDALRLRPAPQPERGPRRAARRRARQRDARRPGRLPRARPPDAAGPSDPHRLGRHPGRGADVRQARARPAREDRAPRGRRGRPGEARRHRRGADRLAGRHRCCPTAPRGAAWRGRANPYGDGLAAERIAAILLGRPFAPFVPPA